MESPTFTAHASLPPSMDPPVTYEHDTTATAHFYCVIA